MNYRIVHTTEYDYSEPVTVSHQILHLLPRPHPRQSCSRAQLKISPEPKTRHDRPDYFGNPETFCCLIEPHTKLRIEAECELAVSAASWPAPDSTPPWESVRDAARKDLAAVEFVLDSPLIRTAPQYAGYAAQAFAAGRPILAALVELTARIHGDFKYDQQATTVATPLEEAFAKRRGVCQDFVHVMIACLRSLGVPARYVSGYIRTNRGPGQSHWIGADASHAWVGVFLAGDDWVELDPTNNLLVSTDHIALAWGRDYGDIAPARGVILGGGQQQLRVTVEVTS